MKDYLVVTATSPQGESVTYNKVGQLKSQTDSSRVVLYNLDDNLCGIIPAHWAVKVEYRTHNKAA